LFHLDREPEVPYLYPLEEGGGAELIKRVTGTKEAVRPSKNKAGTNRKREYKNKPGYLYAPLVVDTEFATTPHPTAGWYHDLVVELCRRLGRGSIPISVQIKGITKESPAEVYLHPDYNLLFPNARPEGLHRKEEPIADYLSQQLGVKVRFDWKGTLEDPDYKAIAKRRVLRLHLFGHFLIADYLRVWGDRRIVDHLKELSRESEDGDREPWIIQSRRIRCARPQSGGRPPSRWLPLPIVAVLDKTKYAIEIDLYDNSAMVGNAGRSYAGFHQVAGIPLESKDNYSGDNKSRMFLQFVRNCDRKGFEAGIYSELIPADYRLEDDTLIASGGPSVFLDYARGDVLTLYRAITGIADHFKRIYRSLGMEAYYTAPKPTTGSTVHNLLRSSAYRLFEGAFEGLDGFLTKADQKLIDKVLEKGFDSLTDKQSEALPRWFYGEEESVPRKFRKVIDKIGFAPAEAQEIATAKNWSGINAKVFGGRIINSAPGIVSCQGFPIADIDLSGCYVSAMYLQQFPIGRPVIIGEAYARGSTRNRYSTLRQFLKEYRSELIPSLWQIWISVEDPRTGEPKALPVDQDRFPSWKAPVSFFDHEEDEEGIWLERSDQVGIHRRQITNCVINSDDLEWIEKVASDKFRTFLLDNAVVKTAMFYPASERRGSAEEYITDYEEFERSAPGGNTSKATIKRGGTKVKNEQSEYQGWFSVNLAELIADTLKRRRGEYKVITAAYKAIKNSEVKIASELDLPKVEAGNRAAIDRVLKAGYPGGLAALLEESKSLSKHPLDELFKLTGNTVYGVLVSRFFALSNPVVGNNITARCRAMIWYYQAACKGWSAITDGGLMRLDQVFYIRNDRMRINESVGYLIDGTSRKIKDAGLRVAPIGGYDSIRWEDDDLVFERDGVIQRFHKSNARDEDNKTGYLDLIDGLILDHTKKSFPEGITILAEESPFTFEAKGAVKVACMRGAGDYYLQGGKHGDYPKGQEELVKMRSYSSKIHKTHLIPFFKEILNNPSKVNRSKHSKVFITSNILQTGKFSEQYKSYYKNTILEPGDTIFEARLFRELGLSGFRFLNEEQARLWKTDSNRYRAVDRERSSFGQSYESFYLDSSGKLNYTAMIRDLEDQIAKGRKPPTYKQPKPHPRTIELQEIRKTLLLEPIADPSIQVAPTPTDIDNDNPSAIDLMAEYDYQYGFDIGEHEEYMVY